MQKTYCKGKKWHSLSSKDHNVDGSIGNSVCEVVRNRHIMKQ